MWVSALLMPCRLVYSLFPLRPLPPRKVLTDDPVQAPERHERREKRNTRKNLSKVANWWRRKRKLLPHSIYFKQQPVYRRPMSTTRLMSPPQVLVYLLEMYWREKLAWLRSRKISHKKTLVRNSLVKQWRAVPMTHSQRMVRERKRKGTRIVKNLKKGILRE